MGNVALDVSVVDEVRDDTLEFIAVHFDPVDNQGLLEHFDGEHMALLGLCSLPDFSNAVEEVAVDVELHLLKQEEDALFDEKVLVLHQSLVELFKVSSADRVDEAGELEQTVLFQKRSLGKLSKKKLDRDQELKDTSLVRPLCSMTM